MGDGLIICESPLMRVIDKVSGEHIPYVNVCGPRREGK